MESQLLGTRGLHPCLPVEGLRYGISQSERESWTRCITSRDILLHSSLIDSIETCISSAIRFFIPTILISALNNPPLQAALDSNAETPTSVIALELPKDANDGRTRNNSKDNSAIFIGGLAALIEAF